MKPEKLLYPIAASVFALSIPGDRPNSEVVNSSREIPQKVLRVIGPPEVDERNFHYEIISFLKKNNETLATCQFVTYIQGEDGMYPCVFYVTFMWQQGRRQSYALEAHAHPRIQEQLGEGFAFAEGVHQYLEGIGFERDDNTFPRTALHTLPITHQESGDIVDAQ